MKGDLAARHKVLTVKGEGVCYNSCRPKSCEACHACSTISGNITSHRLPGVRPATSLTPRTPPKALPELEHFNTTNVDAKADPCEDFYGYADSKWLAAHPIPGDQATWGVASPLRLWNETVLLLALEQNSASDPKRTPNEQKVGDYYFACMDTKAIEAHTAEWLKPELERIARISSKSDIAEELAHLHQTIPGAWTPDDNETSAALFGYSGQPDFDDASKNVAMVDQGGMALPGRSFYLDQDDKAKEIRAKYLKHVANMLLLGGEQPGQADADVVLEMETEMAKAAMDPIARREWGMTPSTIDAYEDPQSNTINFPAGILQPPFFEANQDDAVSYGAIGAVIGHEIIHGYDDEGRKFDARGNLRDWWTSNDAKEYEARGKCISDQYTQEVPEAGPGVKQDGRLTQGEDTADNGGLHLAFMALQDDLARTGKSMDEKGADGFTLLQRFFLAYAFSWCTQYTP